MFVCIKSPFISHETEEPICYLRPDAYPIIAILLLRQARDHLQRLQWGLHSILYVSSRKAPLWIEGSIACIEEGKRTVPKVFPLYIRFSFVCMCVYAKNFSAFPPLFPINVAKREKCTKMLIISPSGKKTFCFHQ